MIFAAIIILLSLETNHSVGDFGLFYFQASVVSCSVNSSVSNCVNSRVNNGVNNCDNTSVNNCVIIAVVHQEAAAAEDP